MPRLLAATLVAATAILAGGCSGPRPQTAVGFATVASILATDDGQPAAPDYAVPGSAARRLGRAVAEIDTLEDVAFTVVMGDLSARGDARSLDRVKSVLDDSKKPYYVVLGPEGGGADEEGHAESPEGGAGQPTARSLIVWLFRGHGFDGPQPYWKADVDGNVRLVALYTGARGAGKPGYVDAKQLQWLESVLAENPGRSVVLFSYHALVSLHPFDATAVWDNRLVDNRRDVLDVVAKHPNVLMAVSSAHGFATGRTVGAVLYVGVPAMSVWPLAYDVLKVTPQKAEWQYVPVGSDEETRTAFDRMVNSPSMVDLFGTGDRGETQIIQTFGGRKAATWNLNTLRP